jgi:hypothetical protein
VPAGPYQASVLHAATRVSDGSVVITGGGTTTGTTRLVASAQAVRVTEDGAAYCQSPLVSEMLFRRFGHQVTELPGRRLLVTGGFADETVGGLRTFRATGVKAEILPLAGPANYPTRVFGPDCTIPGTDGAVTPRDGGPLVPDAGPPPAMCGAGPMPDAGPPPDGGPMVDGGPDGG